MIYNKMSAADSVNSWLEHGQPKFELSSFAPRYRRYSRFDPVSFAKESPLPTLVLVILAVVAVVMLAGLFMKSGSMTVWLYTFVAYFVMYSAAYEVYESRDIMSTRSLVRWVPALALGIVPLVYEF